MRLRFVLSQTFQGLSRNLAMTVSVILVTFVSLTFVGAAALLQIQVGNLKNDWYDKVEVSAFMCPAGSATPACAGGEATQEQIDAVGDLLAAESMAPYVDEVYLESKEDAFEAFQEQMADTVWAQVPGDRGARCRSAGSAAGWRSRWGPGCRRSSSATPRRRA
ncbi:permease-like cell division protein FtsX [Georgenia sp. SUBG003]|uniref:permease-like cell division protein FtsX n=1 Tax=Georgenia sp. SUBG003 TaxID=1497974 RepID=UPI003AB43F69